jgi:hypothetical protein
VWTLSLLSQGKSLSSPETQQRYSRPIERSEPHAYVRGGAGDRKVRNNHRRTENHMTLIQLQQESLVMITLLSSRSRSQLPVRSQPRQWANRSPRRCHPARSQLKWRRQLTYSIGRMATVPTLIARTEVMHTRTEATHTGTPPIPIGIPTPGIPGMAIIEMARPSTITGICKRDSKL